MGVQEILSPHQTMLLKESVTDAARSCARIFCASNYVLNKSLKFNYLGLSPIHTSDKLKTAIIHATISGRLIDHSDWIASWNRIAEVKEERVSEVQSCSGYIQDF